MYFQSALSMNNFRANLCVTPFFGGKRNEYTLLTVTYSSLAFLWLNSACTWDFCHISTVSECQCWPVWKYVLSPAGSFVCHPVQSVSQNHRQLWPYLPIKGSAFVSSDGKKNENQWKIIHVRSHWLKWYIHIFSLVLDSNKLYILLLTNGVHFNSIESNICSSFRFKFRICQKVHYFAWNIPKIR